MRLPGYGTSAEALHETYGVYHLSRLEADERKELATAFGAAQERLKGRMEAYGAARASAMRALAVRDADDDACDNAVRAFAMALRAKSGNNPKAPLYQKYFEDGLNATIGAPLDEELHRCAILLSKLNEEEDPALKPYVQTISSAVATLSQAMDAHRAAMDAEAQAWGLLETEKINWFDAYKRSYRELGRIFFKEPKRADAYFKPFAKGKKNGNGGTAPTGDIDTPRPPVNKA